VQARVNLLERTEEFDQDPPWTPTGASVTANAITAPDGTTTADKLVEDNSNGVHRVEPATISAVSSTQYTASVYAKAGERNKVTILVLSTNTYGYIFDVQNGTLVQNAALAPDDQSITPVGDGWYRCTVTITTVTSAATVRIGSIDASNNLIYQGDGTSGIYIWGAQLEQGSTATTYQRVTTATDYADIGLPRYLEFDGVDDAMATQSVDFSSTDEMTVCAGVYKASDAAVGTVVQNGAVAYLDGQFILFAPSAAAPRYAYGSRGTAVKYAEVTDAALAAPQLSVLTGLSDISTPSVVLRRNAAQIASNTATQGSGTYADAIMQIGTSSTPTFPFNGRIHQLIVRGATTAGALLDQTERFVARKTGVAELAPYRQGSFSWDSSTSSPGAA